MQLINLLLLLGGSSFVTAGWVPQFKNLIAFGDSYTDEHRLNYFTVNQTAPPPGLLLPSSNSTSSGGYVWARLVSFATGAKLYNYAVSGATCSNAIVSRYYAAIKADFPDVVYEVGAFTADAKYINNATGTNTLYTDRQEGNSVYSIWIGTNDLGEGGFMIDSSVNQTAIPAYVDCVFGALDGIYAAGARYFVLMNMAPLQLSPLYGMPGAGGLLTSAEYWPNKPSNTTEVSMKMKEYTQLINALFAYRAPFELKIRNRYPGASIAIFDTNSFLTHVYENPIEYFGAAANVTGTYTNYGSVTVNGNLSSFMWYDALHPAQGTDEAIAAEFGKVVNGTSEYAAYW